MWSPTDVKKKVCQTLPKKDKQGKFVILEFKRMSDVTENYLIRTKDKAEEQYIKVRSPEVSTRTDTRPPRMVGTTSKLHSRRALAE